MSFNPCKPKARLLAEPCVRKLSRHVTEVSELTIVEESLRINAADDIMTLLYFRRPNRVRRRRWRQSGWTSSFRQRSPRPSEDW